MKPNYYEDYYMRQAGYGMPIFVGNRFQRGHGLGNILGGLARMVVPMLKQTGKAVLKEGLRAGANILSDVGSGESLKTSVRKRARQSGSRLVGQATSALNDYADTRPATKKRRLNTVVKNRPSQSTTGRRRKQVKTRNKDIFS